MFYSPAPDATFSRSDLCRLAGIPDGVASFWTKQGLLRPISGGAGRGSHRVFDRVEVSYAAVLAVLQGYGLNIKKLTSVSDMMHEAQALCAGWDMPWDEMHYAATARSKLDRFRRGEDVKIAVIIPDSSVRAGERCEYLPASCERDVVMDTIGNVRDGFNIERCLAFAESLPENLPSDFLQFYLDVRCELDGIDSADPSWLLWPDGEGWIFVMSPEGIGNFPDLPVQGVESAMYVAVGAIIRRVWGNTRRDKAIHHWTTQLQNHAGDERWERRIRERLAELQADE